MKRLSVMTVILILTLILTACGSNAQPVETPAIVAPNQEAAASSGDTEPAAAEENSAAAAINDEFEGALSTRLLLALGTLRLAETDTPVTIEQAPQLLMLWQALDNLSQSGTSAEAEVSALLSQIEQTLTPEQISSINAMKLTQVELQAWAAENGITVGTGTGLEGGAGQGMGQGQSLSAEEKATKQAENGMTGNTSRESGLSASITSALITYLEGIK